MNNVFFLIVPKSFFSQNAKKYKRQKNIVTNNKFIYFFVDKKSTHFL